MPKGLLEFVPAPDRLDPPDSEVHVWRAELDEPRWPSAEGLPEDERKRAESLLRALPRRRWIASRWALRGVLGRYLGRAPAAIRLAAGERGKPRLAEPVAGLAFNLSHSDRLALIAVARDREVGVDLERVADKHPRDFYDRWAEREARAKCLGIGLGGEPPFPAPRIAVRRLDLGSDFAASIATAGPEVAVRGWTFGAPLREAEGRVS
ncbi:MAG TPA: hypothetical protein VFN92_09855 [Solirubrobacterales bacterium]|nr:hypothetical protein [Solirubrobacterales bacterium]